MPLEDGEWEDEASTRTTTTTDPSGPEHHFTDEPGAVEQDSGPHGSHRVSQAETSEAVEPSGTDPEPDTPASFDPRWQTEFEGLMYLGKLEKSFEWLGHIFTIRTLTTDEIIEIGMIHKPYVGTLADVKAYQTAVVAACVVSVDGKSLPSPITNSDGDTPLRNRFEYVRSKWFPPVLDAVYERYLLLEAEVDETLGAMKKAHG